VGLRHHAGADPGTTVGGWIADNWSWRWIFYINLPIGVVAFFMISAFLFDASFQRKPRRVDVLGIVLMMCGFGCLQLVLDVGERQDWFDSTFIVTLSVLAVCMVTAFVVREIMVEEPILDLKVFRDRNFGMASIAIFLISISFNSSILLVALYTQKVLGYDAWTAGLTLAPGGLGTMMALMISGRLVSRMDQRLMLIFGCVLSAVALGLMTTSPPRWTSGTSPGPASCRASRWASSSCRCRRWRWPPSRPCDWPTPPRPTTSYATSAAAPAWRW
jgi:DHA2 family multidrug resistance protein